MKLFSKILEDKIIFSSQDLENFHYLGKKLHVKTKILATFNPGVTRLSNGNILLMVRVAEALSEPVKNNKIGSIRWSKKGYVVDYYPKKLVDTKDPRLLIIKSYKQESLRLTSLSYLLPVELDNKLEIKKIHYNQIIEPENESQEYGVEDPRITKIGKMYYMTAVGVSSVRGVSTSLYESKNGLNWKFKKLIFDNQNKDVILFPKKIKGKYWALTRPEGGVYFTPPVSSKKMVGTSINLASSKDLLHWSPEEVLTGLEKNTKSNKRIGPGTPFIETKNNLLTLFHAVEDDGSIIGNYRTFCLLLDSTDPKKIKYVNKSVPVLEANHKLDKNIPGKYLKNVVFTTGLLDDKDKILVFSGELDLVCRATIFSE